MIHSFDSRVALRLDIESAIIVHNLAFWIKKNISNDKHFFEGSFWTYNSSRAWAELFPYMSQDKIKRRLLRMEKLGLIKSGNFNQIPFDRTKWYTITANWLLDIYDFHCAEMHNTEGEIAQAIPDSKPDSKPLIDFNGLLDFINQKTGRNFKVINHSVKQSYLARLKEGYVKGDIISAIYSATSKEHHKANGFQYLTPEFFSRSATLEKYASQTNTKVKPKEKEVDEL